MHFRVQSTLMLPIILLLLALPVSFAQEFDERFEDWPRDLKVKGRVLVSIKIPSKETLDLALNNSIGELILVCDKSQDEELHDLLHDIEDAQQADVEDAAEENGDSESSSVADHSTKTVLIEGLEFTDLQSQDLHTALAQGNTVCLLGKAAKLAGTSFFSGRGTHPRARKGLGLIPDSAIHNSRRLEATDKRLMSVLTSQSPCVGITLHPNSCLVLDGRKIQVFEESALFSLPGSTWHTAKEKLIVPRESRRQDPNEWWLDLTQWRRQAMERDLPQFPASNPRTPIVENGTLFIVGGGGMPSGLFSDFVEAAGGKDAKLVYVPCSEQDEVSVPQGIVESWKEMGVASATFIHTKDRNQANEDEEFLEPLKDATGIWFGGGRQWNLADSYYGTTAHRLMKEVLKRGGVIGGSSAGASIQGRYLARATPIQNFKLMADGYERGGLGFISGVAIDQHFSQRGRQKDMTELVDRYPQLLGIGIDERTAIIVRKSKAEVVGRGKVHFYDRSIPVIPGEDDFLALEAGATYDLAARRVIEEPARAAVSELESAK